uniref:Uncharacterized protein n=1 Tax=Trichogramma kaykai TaxID=54128 RepID=A0ABD2WZF5_9HYME
MSPPEIAAAAKRATGPHPHEHEQVVDANNNASAKEETFTVVKGRRGRLRDDHQAVVAERGLQPPRPRQRKVRVRPDTIVVKATGTTSYADILRRLYAVPALQDTVGKVAGWGVERGVVTNSDHRAITSNLSDHRPHRGSAGPRRRWSARTLDEEVFSERLSGTRIPYAMSERLEDMAGALITVITEACGAGTSSRRRFYANVIDSILLYGAPIWSCGTGTRAGIRRAEAIHRRACLRVISGRLHLSHDATYVLASIPPLALLADERSRLYQRRHGDARAEERQETLRRNIEKKEKEKGDIKAKLDKTEESENSDAPENFDDIPTKGHSSSNSSIDFGINSGSSSENKSDNESSIRSKKFLKTMMKGTKQHVEDLDDIKDADDSDSDAELENESSTRSKKSLSAIKKGLNQHDEDCISLNLTQGTKNITLKF